jgi:hypothetical protein
MIGRPDLSYQPVVLMGDGQPDHRLRRLDPDDPMTQRFQEPGEPPLAARHVQRPASGRGQQVQQGWQIDALV